ncbi:MAG: aminotransferase class III-fold pyridoxal phosphate-dependent enzyme [Deltaproteobacteria bacterium]|nr:aminotransferase class III-fold pyridoxal phosphate-dependent enzyme [Deltaproteobacteria bacterium]
MDALKQLNDMQAKVGPRTTNGLSHDVLQRFLATDPRLAKAIDEAAREQASLIQEFPEFAKLDEDTLIIKVQANYVNFYAEDQRNPYVAIAARGPWLVTFHGAVLHDSGGYGMIGFGHAPEAVIAAMDKPVVMANIMTPSFSQHRLAERLHKAIGFSRAEGCPYQRFLCMNSGSESMTVATRISDINAKRQTDAGGRHAGQRIMYLSLKGGFHGRTERPAMLSDSSAKNYRQNLASFRDLNVTYTVEPNNLAELQAAFDWADREGVFFESTYLEPVMGEGDPGKAITPEFYALARKLTLEHGSLLVVDAIQAGMRATGCLSIVDYPGFEKLPAPDMETYSKAVNAGQYPLSILAMNATAANLYIRGVYGNTMTTNPRALDVAVAVLDEMTPDLRRNVQERGREFVTKFKGLQDRYPKIVRKVQGTGLIVSIDIDPSVFAVVGKGQLEEYLRRNGIGVIHGGINSLRFTPHFGITTPEIDLVVNAIAHAFEHGPKKI